MKISKISISNPLSSRAFYWLPLSPIFRRIVFQTCFLVFFQDSFPSGFFPYIPNWSWVKCKSNMLLSGVCSFKTRRPWYILRVAARKHVICSNPVAFKYQYAQKSFRIGPLFIAFHIKRTATFILQWTPLRNGIFYHIRNSFLLVENCT